MATSIQVVSGRAEAFKDLDLLVLTCLMNQEVAARRGQYPFVAPFVRLWIRELGTYGPGTVHLRLDEILSSEPAAMELTNLLDAADAAVSAFGTTVPGALLNANCSVAGVRFSDYPTALLTDAVRRLRLLVRI